MSLCCSYCLETTVSVIEEALGGKQPVSHKLKMQSTQANASFDASFAGRLAQEQGLGDAVCCLHSVMLGSVVFWWLLLLLFHFFFFWRGGCLFYNFFVPFRFPHGKSGCFPQGKASATVMLHKPQCMLGICVCTCVFP